MFPFSRNVVRRCLHSLRPLVLIALLLLAGCSGGNKNNTTGPTNVAAVCGSGSLPPVATANVLLVTRDQSLYARDMRLGKESKVCTAPAGLFVTYPAWAPDGKSFAFMLDAPFTGAAGSDWGSDLYLADASSASQKLLVKHDQPGASQESPSWTPDGKTIIFSYFLTQYDAQGQYKGQIYQARRYDFASGAATPMLDGAYNTDLCRDGSMLTYVDSNQVDFTSFGVWVADSNGKNGKQVVGAESNLQAFYSPRFSPNCKHIIFAGVGGTLRNLQAPAPSANGLLARFRGLFSPAAVDAHGPPWDLWSVGTDGSDLKRITHVSEDLPFPDWSADGQTVVFLGYGGLYQMAPDGTNIKKIDQGATHGQVAWHQ